MNIQEVYDIYIKSDFIRNKSSLGVYKEKINKYISVMHNTDIRVAFEEENLRTFIFDNKQSPQGKYEAFNNFYMFYHERILHIPKRDVPVFPIDKRKEIQSLKKDKVREPIYFPKEFDLNILFDDHFYEHLALMQPYW
ncbi:hypothetical protein SAMN04487944_1178 [Gracilibacillus ureilyticus]|uniref:Uncharacterized protein n=1 Tax=Gracilibacillus ureilyticus TaxID=531814 RepID=A0A1H9UCU3_9BACI|nr:hypothetical protein [Gracilibacillus ureilyticus]SES06974.1 hypothetical protein SAMN04487944_1178 [Gracilibacillus ureilyticus]